MKVIKNIHHSYPQTYQYVIELYVYCNSYNEFSFYNSRNIKKTNNKHYDVQFLNYKIE